MEFFTKVLSGNGRLKQRDRAAEQVNDNFKASLENLKKSVLESEESVDVLDYLNFVYDKSFPEEQVFMKKPSRPKLNLQKKFILGLMRGLEYLGVPMMSEMLDFIEKHGLEEIAESLMTVLDCLSPLLEGKEAPKFLTDDVMNEIDSKWLSRFGVGSPLLNAIASATSPRTSAALIAEGTGHEIFSSFQENLAPPLHPSSSDICRENVDDQAGDNCVALENDKNLSNGNETEGKEEAMDKQDIETSL